MKRVLGICLFLLLTPFVFAGDIAHFQNLGFSGSGDYFVFGQYGVVEDSLELYAEIYLVDVRANRFVPDGVKSAVYNEKLEPGQDGIGALFTLLKTAEPLVQQYEINHMKSGRLLYILVNGDEPKSHLAFRDFTTRRSYGVDLMQTRTGEGESVKASFHINLSVTERDGSEKTFTVGLPKYSRSGVVQYKIRRILLSPDGTSLIFVVEKQEATDSSINIRYMVETVNIG